MLRPATIKVGDVFETSKSGLCTVVEYVHNKNVKVEFNDTGFILATNVSNLRKGLIRDPYARCLYGGGFLGEGEPASINGKRTKAYLCWQNVFTRCYSEVEHNRHPTYKGCTVAPRWHSFQNFAKDIKTLVGYDLWLNADPFVMCLDKDLISPGNKIYSITTCKFISTEENYRDAMRRKSN